MKWELREPTTPSGRGNLHLSVLDDDTTLCDRPAGKSIATVEPLDALVAICGACMTIAEGQWESWQASEVIRQDALAEGLGI